MTIRVIKKNGKIQEWLPEKIEKAINQSAKRATSCKLTEKQNSEVIQLVEKKIAEKNKDKDIVDVSVLELHSLV